MNDTKRGHGAQMGALALSVVITMAAAIGLTTASEQKASRPGAAATGNGSASLPCTASTGTPSDDPELMRLDRANVNHG